MEAHGDTDVQIVRQTRVQERKTNRTTEYLVLSEVSLRKAGIEQLYQVKRMIKGIVKLAGTMKVIAGIFAPATD